MDYWKLTRIKFMNTRLLIYLVSIAVFSACATFNIRFLLESRPPLTNRIDFHSQVEGKSPEQENGNSGMTAIAVGRKLLGGVGSSPPRCTSKCGRCTPCRPVHVPVPPGTPVTAEYYPEAWRCKCGNQLYIP